MMKLNLTAIALGTGLTFHAAAGELQTLKTERDKASYAVGVEVARSFQRQDIDINVDLMTQGIKDAFSKSRLRMPEKDLRTLFISVQAEARKNMVLNRRAAAELNRRAGAAFLADNGSKPEVVKLPDGVQYTIIKSGNGSLPRESDTIECDYRGNLLNGTEFDASQPGTPSHLKISSISPPGWKEVLRRMPVGSKWRIVVPAAAGYGEQGVGSEIGPNETLIYETELLGIDP
jgi:FKBP-type peptidyl-prolyl cis-trans isomerase